MKISRRAYVEMFGPTVGDRVRLADTELIVFDSSRVGINRLAVTDPMYRTYTAQMRQAFALASRKPGTVAIKGA